MLFVGVNFPDSFLLPDVPGVREDDDDAEDGDDENDEEDDPCSSSWSWPAPTLLVPLTPGIVLSTDGGDCVGGGVLAGDVTEGGEDGDGVAAVTPQAAWCLCPICPDVSSCCSDPVLVAS